MKKSEQMNHNFALQLFGLTEFSIKHKYAKHIYPNITAHWHTLQKHNKQLIPIKP